MLNFKQHLGDLIKTSVETSPRHLAVTDFSIMNLFNAAFQRWQALTKTEELYELVRLFEADVARHLAEYGVDPDFPEFFTDHLTELSENVEIINRFFAYHGYGHLQVNLGFIHEALREGSIDIEPEIFF